MLGGRVCRGHNIGLGNHLGSGRDGRVGLGDGLTLLDLGRSHWAGGLVRGRVLRGRSVARLGCVRSHIRLEINVSRCHPLPPSWLKTHLMLSCRLGRGDNDGNRDLRSRGRDGRVDLSEGLASLCLGGRDGAGGEIGCLYQSHSSIL